MSGHIIYTHDSHGNVTHIGTTLCPVDLESVQLGHACKNVVFPLGLCLLQPNYACSARPEAMDVPSMPVLPNRTLKKCLDMLGAPCLAQELTGQHVRNYPSEDEAEHAEVEPAEVEHAEEDAEQLEKLSEETVLSVQKESSTDKEPSTDKDKEPSFTKVHKPRLTKRHSPLPKAHKGTRRLTTTKPKPTD